MSTIKNIFAIFQEADWIALDTETTGLDWKDTPFLLGFAAHHQGDVLKTGAILGPDMDSLNTAYYEDNDILEGNWEASLEEHISLSKQVWAELPKLLKGKKLIFHNAKFDVEKLARMGYNLYEYTSDIDDTLCLQKLKHPKDPAGLKEVASSMRLGTPYYESLAAQIKSMGFKKSDGYNLLPLRTTIPYVIEDATITALLYESFIHDTSNIYKDSILKTPVYKLEKAALQSFFEMEMPGMAVDMQKAQDQRDQLNKLIESVKSAYAPLNLNSPAQLKAHFYSTWKLTLENTQYEYLTELSNKLHSSNASPGSAVAFIKDLVAYKKASKIVNTYLTNILKEQDNGIIHPWISPFSTITGRTSSKKTEG